MLGERVDDRGVRVGDQEHVGLLDLLEPADRRPVEAETVLEDVGGQLVRGDGEVLHEPGKVAESHVDDVDTCVLDQLENVARVALLHFEPPSRRSEPPDLIRP